MMRKFLLIMAVLGTFLIPASASAVDVFNGACSQGNGGSSAACASRNSANPLTGPNGVLRKVTLVVAAVAGVGAVLVILLSGLKYIQAGGDPAKVADAKNTLMYAIVGLIIIAAAESIISFILSRL